MGGHENTMPENTQSGSSEPVVAQISSEIEQKNENVSATEPATEEPIGALKRIRFWYERNIKKLSIIF